MENSTGWPDSITPQAAGFAPDLGDRLDHAVAGKRLWNLNGLVVLRHGHCVLECYRTGEDRQRGVGPIGRVAFTQDTPHDLRSCSKSIVALQLVIAITAGNYGHPGQWIPPTRVLREIVLVSLLEDSVPHVR